MTPSKVTITFTDAPNGTVTVNYHALKHDEEPQLREALRGHNVRDEVTTSYRGRPCRATIDTAGETTIEE